MKSTPALSYALSHVLERCIERCKHNSDELLPTASTLATQAGVARQTMRNALATLRERGLVTMRYRRGFAVTGDMDTFASLLRTYTYHTPESDAPEAREPIWRLVAEKLKKDIMTGAFHHAATLPSYKQLQARYHTSFKTIKTALAHCEKEGLCKKSHTRYVIDTHTLSHKKRHVCLLTLHNTMSGGPSVNQDFERALHTACMQRELGIHTVQWNIDENAELVFYRQTTRIPDLPQERSIAGYIVAAGFTGIVLEKLLRRISHVDKPVAIFDDSGEWTRPWYLKQPHIRIFTAAISPEPGRHVAAFLGETGHSHVAYISPFHKARWSRNRLAGMEKALARYTWPAHIHAITLDNPPVINTFYEKDALSDCNVKDLIACYRSWRERNPSYLHEVLDTLFFTNLPHKIIPRAYFHARLHRLFEQALAHSDITAWVGANDEIAIQALRFLQQRGIDVPGRISVIGFDDSPDAGRHELSSYNFNMPALVHLMLEYIVFNRTLSEPGRKKPFSVRGTVVERMTSAPAP
jgi:DNA-binding LacI/PurR family transcriptional regulator/DNA-binding transcriptional regulator YhcF (GntR family)